MRIHPALKNAGCWLRDLLRAPRTKSIFFHLIDKKNFTIILGPEYVTVSDVEYHLPRTSTAIQTNKQQHPKYLLCQPLTRGCLQSGSRADRLFVLQREKSKLSVSSKASLPGLPSLHGNGLCHCSSA